jgi:branched-chain amino acid transport system ATP-binding protein
MTSVLSCDGLDAGYGRTRVVRGFDLEVSAGEIVALLGPNGAGKTTLLLTMAGLLPKLGGCLRLDGEDMGAVGAATVARRGLVLVPDDRSLFTTLTVGENLALACRRGGPCVPDVLQYFPALSARLNLTAGQLSGGEQQMLAIGRAMLQRPKVLLIDELSMGLAPLVVEALLPIVRRLADQEQAGVVLVEQHVRLALAVADRAVVLVHGEMVLAGAASDLAANDARLEAAYLGDVEGRDS